MLYLHKCAYKSYIVTIVNCYTVVHIYIYIYSNAIYVNKNVYNIGSGYYIYIYTFNAMEHKQELLNEAIARSIYFMEVILYITFLQFTIHNRYVLKCRDLPNPNICFVSGLLIWFSRFLCCLLHINSFVNMKVMSYIQETNSRFWKRDHLYYIIFLLICICLRPSKLFSPCKINTHFCKGLTGYYVPL